MNTKLQLILVQEKICEIFPHTSCNSCGICKWIKQEKTYYKIERK